MRRSVIVGVWLLAWLGGFAAAQGPLSVWGIISPQAPNYFVMPQELEPALGGTRLEYRAITPPNTYLGILTPAIQGGEGPDVYWNWHWAWRRYAQAGTLEPLGTHIATLQDRFPESVLNKVSLDGQIYGVPLNETIMSFYYNEDLLAEHGVAAPEPFLTWDQFIALNEQLLAAGVAPLAMVGKGNGSFPKNSALAIGAAFYGQSFIEDVAAGRAAFTDEPFVDVLRRFGSLAKYYQPGYLGMSPEDVYAVVALGEVAMIHIPDATVRSLLEINPDLALGQFILRKDEASEPATLSWGHAWFVNAAAKQPEAALELARYFSSPEYAQLVARSGLIPATKDALELLEEPLVIEAAQFLPYTVTPLWDYFSDGEPGFNPLANSLFEGLLLESITPEEAARQLQEGMAVWYPAFQ
jgi:raffinose/stachyose/melibiose transport system substrate-binding protein